MRASTAFSSHTLFVRMASAFVMAPIAIGAVYLGGWPFAALVGLLAGLAMWEWQHLTLRRHLAISLALMVLAVPVGILILHLSGFWPAIGAFFALAVLAALVSAKEGAKGMRWAVAGALYIGLPMLALIWLRQSAGMMPVFWMLGVIWAADSGAYFAGSLIGGAKLAPSISPNKTWAGFFGALVLATIVSLGFAYAMNWSYAALIVSAVVVALWAQLGDLVESKIKRHFQVKDSSRLIPGHGGVLDRVDSLLFCSPLVAFAAALGLDMWQGAGA